MRILHVIPHLHPRNGGPPVIAASLASAQSQLGHSVTLLSNGDEETTRLLGGLAPIDGKLDIVLNQIESKSEQWLGSATARAVESRIRNFDVVHLHNVWEPMLARSARIARRHGVPYVVLVNGMLDPWSLAQSPNKKRLAMAAYVRRTLRDAAALHLGTRWESDVMANLGLPDRHAVIPNGIWADKLGELPTPGAFRARHQIGAEPFILFLSRIHFKKGLDLLMSAFEKLAAKRDDIRLVIAGPDDGYGATLDRLINVSPVKDRIRVVGPIYHREKFEALVDADVFCLPSRQEGFPVVVIEALSTGVPTLVSRECHVDEAVDNGVAIATPLDPTSIAIELEHILSDNSLRNRRNRLSSTARQFVRDRYSWPAIAGETIKLYERILAERKK
jgi:glycosyltransferase involved in cell wall biosynthesis